MNDCIFYQSNDSLNNRHNRDEEMQTYRKQDRKDIFSVPAEVVLHLLNHLEQNQVQTDVYIYGIDTFDCRIYLCRIYKVNESCTLGNKLV